VINAYACSSGRLMPLDLAAVTPAETPVWIDLLNPTSDEDKLVEELLGLDVPTRAEMEEIEPSSRLYHESGAEFMTMTALTGLETDDPVKTPVTFILKGTTLVTVRYAEPKPFHAYTLRAQRPNAMPCQTGELVMLGLLEALIDRIADTLERVANEVDATSAEIFRKKASTASRKTRNLQSMIERIGKQGDLLSKIRESLVSINRLTSYHAALDGTGRPASKESRARTKVVQRDVTSLGEHAAFLSNKVNFLLDATLGLINLEQNQIIKIFSVAAVVFLPPTLVASIYGMNFDHMPELHWLLGYPWAIFLMILSAVLPFFYFKRKGWL
jgi:magnesium transporter